MSFLYTSANIFCSFFIILYSIISVANAANDADPECDKKVHSSGTGTVLFNPTDVYKTCWSQEEIAILTARVIFEDVIPDPKMISIQCNDDVEDLVEYFKTVIDTTRSSTKARKRHIMLLALTDLLGGFLHHALLPRARKAYYSGAVDYVYMEKLIQLYEELKWFLRTNGQGWTRPMMITQEVKVPIIEIGAKINIKPENESCCHKVMFYEHEPLTSRKRSVNIEKGLYFPLPFFDAKIRPTAIALPLKHFGLRNIESKRAAYVLMKYFISAEQCLKEKDAKPGMIEKFQNNLYTWIEKEVIPKLDDDKFYSAFGGILRVQYTLKALGARIGNKPCVSDEGEEEVGAIPGIGCSSGRNKLLLIAMLVIIVAWFLMGTCFICYRMKNSPKINQIDDAKSDKGSRSSSSFSSSRWSSMLSRSSSKTDKQLLCKCCESTISERTSAEFSSTSEYESERVKKNTRKPLKKSSPCVCPPNNGPAIIDAKHSMKVLPSIAEISENSLPKRKSSSFRKITFADESAISSSDGGIQVCAPPWEQIKGTIPCPRLSDKSTNYSSITTTKSQDNSSRADDPSLLLSQDKRESEEPLGNSTVTTTDYGTSNMSNANVKKKESMPATAEEYLLNDEDRSKRGKEEEENSYYNYMAACHSSMSGNYELFRKSDPSKPYIYGYDFQTSTSSEVSDGEESK